MTKDNAYQNGFTDGYNAALNDKPKKPNPSLAGTLALSEFLLRYMSGYDEGYRQGKSDRALLLQGREQTEEWRLLDYEREER